jgi:YVTN family beta-propeller protein
MKHKTRGQFIIRQLLSSLLLVLILFLLNICAFATRLPSDLRKNVLNVIHNGSVRIDGAISTDDGLLYLPLVPAKQAGAKKEKDKDKIEIDEFYPSANNPDIIFYTNSWAHIKTIKKGDVRTILLPANMPEKIKKRVLNLVFPFDLIVPEGFVMPKSLKSLAKELPVAIVDDAAIDKPDFGIKKIGLNKEHYKGYGTIFATSIVSGTVSVLDGKSLNKIVEFPTEGTPCGMDFAEGRLYIADQAKNRILMLDPIAKKFIGQIDLPPSRDNANMRSAPKSVAAFGNGKLLYVSESGLNDIAVIELATQKMLMRTKVSIGPSRIALTPDGIFLLVLDVTAGEVTIISTYNQKVICSIKVGNIPTDITISKDSKHAYVSNRMSNTISIIDITKRMIVGTIQCGQAPTGLCLSNDNKHLFVVNARDNTISTYDINSLLKTNEIKLPLDVDFPGPLCLLPDGNRLLVTSQQTDVIAVVDISKPNEPVKLITVGHPMHDIFWAPVN